jgi:hypothetical protein
LGEVVVRRHMMCWAAVQWARDSHVLCIVVVAFARYMYVAIIVLLLVISLLIRFEDARRVECYDGDRCTKLYVGCWMLYDDGGRWVR